MKKYIIIAKTFTFIFINLICHATTNKVERVIDGDTFEIETGQKVRMIGINAPELSDMFGIEAKKYLFDLIMNKEIELKDDIYSNKSDRYNRLLKYVYLNGVDINNKMILDGYATAYLKFKFEKSSEYLTSQINAKKLENGMWGIETMESRNDKTSFIAKNNLLSLKGMILIIGLILLIIIGIVSYYQK